jgi:hypothetical protein
MTVRTEATGDPDDVAITCFFPSSGEAGYVNRTTIEIEIESDAGMLAGVLHESGRKTTTDLLQTVASGAT